MAYTYALNRLNWERDGNMDRHPGNGAWRCTALDWNRYIQPSGEG